MNASVMFQFHKNSSLHDISTCYYSGFAAVRFSKQFQTLVAFADQSRRTATSLQSKGRGSLHFTQSQQLLLHCPDSQHTRTEAEEAGLLNFSCCSRSHTFPSVSTRDSVMACCCSVSQNRKDYVAAELYTAVYLNYYFFILFIFY